MSSSRETFAFFRSLTAVLAFLLFILVSWASPAAAQEDAKGVPHTGIMNGEIWFDARYRYEFVEQANLPKDARASTLRIAPGFETGFFHGFRAAAQGEFVVQVGAQDYNDTINGKTQYPVVADVPSSELNQAYLESFHLPGTVIKGGRYAENLDNMRYVGSVAWRQNDQTFDGAKVTTEVIPGVTALYAYIGNVNRIFSDDSEVGNLNSNIHLMHLKSDPLPFGTLTGYTYLMDIYDAPALSNASYGGFLEGEKALGGDVTFDYRVELALQTDFGDQPVQYDAPYARVAPGLSWKGFRVSPVYELLGSDNGRAAFQTPLATGHIFNGFADIFLVTPADGLQDFFVEASYKAPKQDGRFRWLSGLLLLAQYHEFRSDVGDIDYGSEFDAYANLPLPHGFYAELKYANYRADNYATDTEKVIFGLGYQY